MLWMLLSLLACSGRPAATPVPTSQPPPPAQVGTVTAAHTAPAVPAPVSAPPPSDDGGALSCRDASGGPVSGPDCVTATISCGDTVRGNTRGGTQRFDTQFYEKKHCWPGTVNKDGGDERVYRLTLPRARLKATVTLNTPCADLDVMAFPWTGDTCPSVDHNVLRCECMRKEGRQSETLQLVSQNTDTWYIVVEGRDAEEGAFELSVACGEWY
ncbi:MAG: hypothetical protein JXX28_06775 [Deltaproteobacteria bacterium]|nr:hypothetical protein [Deltaproteobacteria bacterium]